MASVKSPDELRIMREAGRHVAEVVQILVEALEPGMATLDLDKIVRKEYARRGIVAPFLGYAYPPYPATVCVSINDELVHGIPGAARHPARRPREHRPRRDLQGFRRRPRRDRLRATGHS